MTPRTVLLADALNCGTGAVLIAAVPAVWRATGLPGRFRLPTAGALAATTVIFGAGAARQDPARRDLTLASITNAGWTAAGLLAVTQARTPLGQALAGTVTVLDAAMAAIQWRFRDHR